MSKTRIPRKRAPEMSPADGSPPAAGRLFAEGLPLLVCGQLKVVDRAWTELPLAHHRRHSDVARCPAQNVRGEAVAANHVGDQVADVPVRTRRRGLPVAVADPDEPRAKLLYCPIQSIHQAKS